MPKITIESRIKEELDRINGLFEDVDANQKAAMSSLIQNAAFMKVTLEDLQDNINKSGTTDEYQNGANQYGVKQSATLQAYNSLIKNYANVIKILTGLLPPERKKTTAYNLGALPIRSEKTPEEIEEEERREAERIKQINAEIERAAEYQRKQREKTTA